MNGRTNSNNSTTGFEIEVPLDPVTNVSASAGDGQVELTWTDPLDKYAATEGEVAESPNPIVSQWDHTRVVRKENTQPAGPNDGVIVLSSDVRNQYQSTSYVDSGLINDTLYHYGLFACNTAGIFSTGTFGSATPKAGTPLSQLSEGTIIKILENGSPVEYLIVNQGLPSSMYDASCDGCWVLRKDIAENRRWDTGNNDYKNSDIHAYLNGNWTSRYEAGILSQIKQIKIPYVNGTGNGPVASGANGLSCKIFLLSGYEIGWNSSVDSHFPSDGTKLSYFSSGTSSTANKKRIANYNGNADSWSLRSLYTGGNVGLVWRVRHDGEYDYANHITPYGIRPALILPSTALVDQDLNIIEEVSA